MDERVDVHALLVETQRAADRALAALARVRPHPALNAPARDTRRVARLAGLLALTTLAVTLARLAD